MAIKKSSKVILYEAFYELAKTKPLEDITVQDILDYSGVSRSTFYRHFADKYDVMSWAYTSWSNDMLLAQFDSAPSLCQLQKEISLAAAYNYYNNRAYFSNISKYEGQNSLRKVSYRNGIAYYDTMLTKGGMEKISDELLFAIKFYVFGATQMLLDWMESGFLHTPEEHVRYLQEVMPECLQQAIADIDRRRKAIDKKPACDG